MELPADTRERDALYRNLLRSAELASRTDRRDRFRRMRALNLTGTANNARARVNNLKEWRRLSASLIYNQKGVTFGLSYPPHYGGKDPERLTTDELEQMAELAREDLHYTWYDSDMPTEFGKAVHQAHYADTSWLKLLVNRNEIMLALVPDPSDICVGDEAVPVSQQEVIVHFYAQNLYAFHRQIHGLEPSFRQKVWDAAQNEASAQSDTPSDSLPGALPRIILASAQPTMSGNVANTFDTMLGLPRSKEQKIELAELWVWDDRARRMCKECLERRGSWRHTEAWIRAGVGHEYVEGELVPDWRAVTLLASTLDILYDPVNPLGIEGHAFFPLCLEPDSTANYAYGIAPQEDLIGAQEWSEYKWDQLNERDDIDMDPPISAYGVPMRDGETTARWRKKGADIPLNSPQAKIEFHRPPPLPDKYEMVDRIDAKMRRQEGIPKVMAGETEAGVRSGEQAMAQALLGAGPTLDHAMAVERCLEAVATAAMHLKREISDRPLVRDNGERFLLRQMPADFSVTVWGHSASPIYTEHNFQKAVVLRKTGDISGEDMLIYANLPNTDMLRRKQKKLAEGQAQMQEKKVELADRKVKAQELKAVK